MKIKSISLGNLPNIFMLYGFFNDEVNCIFQILISLWKCNDNNYDLTCEYIRTEMDLDELRAQLLINDTAFHLNVVATQIRNVALTGKLIRYNVIGSVILLEVNDE